MVAYLLLALALTTVGVYSQGQLGARQSQVQWRGGHAGAYIEPYVIVYGGSQNAAIDPGSPNITGTNELWVWNSIEGAWYHPKVETANTIPGQIFFSASDIPSPGQMVAIATNTTGGANWLQKLDTNSWSWSFPTATLPPPQHASGYAITLLNNSLYYFGGLSVDQNGVPIQNSVLNSLYSMDANNYVWTPKANGPGVTDHVICYIPSCNCLISYGGTRTGEKASPTPDVYVYSIATGTWNVQMQVQTVNNAAPGARRLHTANCLDDRMIVFGGGTDRPFDTNVWILDASQYPTLTWRNQPMSNLSDGPNARMGHTAVLDKTKQKIYIFGGWGVGNTYDTNMYILDYHSWGWTRVSPAGFNSPVAPIPTATQSSNMSSATSSNSVLQGDPLSSDDKKEVVIGAAVGGTIGGALVLAGLCFLLVRRSRKRQREEKTLSPEFEDDEDMGTASYYANRGSMSSPNMPIPSLSELPTTTASENSMSYSFLPLQSPNEVIMQKPNEFTRPLMRSVNSSMLASAGITSPTTGMSNAATVPYMHFSIPTNKSTTSTLSSVPIAQRVSVSTATVASPTATTRTSTDLFSENDFISPLDQLARIHTLPLPPDRYTMEPAPRHAGLTNKVWFGTRDGVPVALKVFGRREAWERECRVLVKLRESSYIVRLVEMMTIGNTNTDYVTVLERLRPAELSRKAMHDIAACLAFCHANEIAFCDLKPSNIMQDDSNHKLIDFEASRTIGQECVGLITPRYCPPEVARATTYGIESSGGVVAAASVDLWSLGCLIYELEAKQPLFPSNVSDETVLHFISHPSPLTPALINGLRWNEQVELEIPALHEDVQDPSARDLIKTLLSQDPVKRGSASHWLKNHPYFLQEQGM
ncbi:hypothetical protein BX666DRAFT_1979960 [Dichotomocladium elegans]|nr:hypothetical protein BX666DRAFT_1979960 [Dichotomocladium elegans]